MNVLRRDLRLLLFLLLLHVFPQLRVRLIDLAQVAPQPRDKRLAELRAVLVHALLLRVLPDLQHEREQHAVERRLVRRVRRRRGGRRARLELLHERREVRGPLRRDVVRDLRDARLEHLVARDVGAQRGYARLALFPLLVDRALLPSAPWQRGVWREIDA